MTDLPTATVTFLFSDIDGSTRLAEKAPDAYPTVLERHREPIREAVAHALVDRVSRPRRRAG